MAHRYKPKSLKQWCIENGKEFLLDEIDIEEIDRRFAKGYVPDRVEYNSATPIQWRCKDGHKWSCEIVGRTLFRLCCPQCDANNAVLPIGTKYGCLTIIDGFDAYQREIAAKEIKKLEIRKEEFLQGIRDPHSNVDSVDFYNNWIAEYQNRNKLYKCQCKCGKIQYRSQFSFLEAKHRYCTNKKTTKDFLRLSESDKDAYLHNLCGMAVEAEKKKYAGYRRVFDKNYNIDFSGKLFESLEVIECVDDNFEVFTSYSDLRKRDGGTFTVYKVYNCKCYLCGKEIKVKCSQFHIDPPTQYGYNAYHGYWAGVYCDCHEISSFQWIVNKLLLENGVPYRVEYTFHDLYGAYGKKLLQFDFCVLNDDGSIKALIECQGEQHYTPIQEFGGNIQFQNQIKNDELKREYAKNHNIKLIEISYKEKKYEQIGDILKKEGIL